MAGALKGLTLVRRRENRCARTGEKIEVLARKFARESSEHSGLWGKDPYIYCRTQVSMNVVES